MKMLEKESFPIKLIGKKRLKQDRKELKMFFIKTKNKVKIERMKVWKIPKPDFFFFCAINIVIGNKVLIMCCEIKNQPVVS